MLTSFIVLSISMGVVYLFGCTGEIVIEKGGNLNLGIPGIMSLGALGGVIGSRIYFALFGVDSVVGVVLLIMISGYVMIYRRVKKKSLPSILVLGLSALFGLIVFA